MHVEYKTWNVLGTQQMSAVISSNLTPSSGFEETPNLS